MPESELKRVHTRKHNRVAWLISNSPGLDSLILHSSSHLALTGQENVFRNAHTMHFASVNKALIRLSMTQEYSASENTS